MTEEEITIEEFTEEEVKRLEHLTLLLTERFVPTPDDLYDAFHLSEKQGRIDEQIRLSAALLRERGARGEAEAELREMRSGSRGEA